MRKEVCEVCKGGRVEGEGGRGRKVEGEGGRESGESYIRRNGREAMNEAEREGRGARGSGREGQGVRQRAW